MLGLWTVRQEWTKRRLRRGHLSVTEAVQAMDRLTAVDELVVGSKAAKALPLEHLLIVRLVAVAGMTGGEGWGGRCGLGGQQRDLGQRHFSMIY
jgi:hypothetical protein